MTVAQTAPFLRADPEAAPVILVVDDSRAQRILLCKTLERWGYTTLEADCGQAALDICMASEVRFVISDWMMPGMTGVDFCRAYRAHLEGRPGYFILLTAQTDRERLAEGLDGGADDFLSKPFHNIELKARIRAGQRVLDAQSRLHRNNGLLSDALDELREVHSAVDRDLREARQFQQALVPERFRHLPGGDVTFLYEPAGHVGGDLVGLFRVNEARYGLFSIDVSGHGVASALMTARVAAHLNSASPERNLALAIDDTGLYEMHPPHEVCARLNALMLNEMDTDTYLTMVLADADLRTGRIRLAQAGHPSPVVQRRDGRVEFVSSFGMPIGLIPGAEYSSFEVWLDPGDRLLIYSDGITECPRPDNTLLEEDGLAAILRSHRGMRGAEFTQALMAALRETTSGAEFPDDLSCVLIERASEQDA